MAQGGDVCRDVTFSAHPGVLYDRQAGLRKKSGLHGAGGCGFKLSWQEIAFPDGGVALR